ncbi:MAG TPA: hypothetical protein ENF87_00675, partial [Thermoproteales archaeon]|nr:hypothetical protein [Thermoproteales archaeon]
MKKPLILILLITLSLGFAEPIKVLTPFGTPMSGAEVEIRLLDGTTIKNVLDVNGEVAVRDVPLGIVFLRIVKWRGYP